VGIDRNTRGVGDGTMAGDVDHRIEVSRLGGGTGARAGAGAFRILARMAVTTLAGPILLLAMSGPVPAGASGPEGATHSVARNTGSQRLAGNGTSGFNGDGKEAIKASLNAPDAVIEDAVGNLFIADTGNCRVREVPVRTGMSFGKQVRAGTLVTLAGGSCRDTRVNPPPTALALPPNGNLYIAFAAAARVMVLPARNMTSFGEKLTVGKLTRVAGTGVPGFGGDGGIALKAQLDDPTGLAVDAAGDLLVADTANCRLRMVAASDGVRFGSQVVRGQISTVAGNGICGSVGDGGPARHAELWDPGALAVNSAGDVFVADQGNRTIRELTTKAGTYYGVPIAADDIGTVAGEGAYGPYLVDGLPAVFETSEINFPTGIAVADNGNLYIADGAMHAIRMVPASQTTLLGKVALADDMYTAAGAVSVGTLHHRTTWVQTRLLDPVGLALGADGQLIYADRGGAVVGELPVGT
jgi:trimeric autotransporter adhesin